MTMIRLWLYSIASLLSLTVLLAARHFSAGTHAQLMRESLGVVIVLLSCQICFRLNGVDELLADSRPQIFPERMLKSAGAGLLLAAALFYIFPRLSPGYVAAAGSACVLMFGLVALRPIVRSAAQRQEIQTTLIVGSAAAARAVADGAIVEPVRVSGYAELGRLVNQRISRVVVADPWVPQDGAAAQALIDLKLRGLRIEGIVDSVERTSRKLWIGGLSADRLIFADGFAQSKVYNAVKRAFDIFLSAFLLCFTAPLMVFIAAAIRLDSAGPAIFSQERVGFRGRRITVHKFRSMREDAELETGPVWAKENDDRVTRVGAFLRRCRLDELPQLWDVLSGDMSLIGPRPERPYFVDLLKQKIPYFDLRHCVKPGITGWAQVMYPYGASVADAYRKLEYDLYYLKHISLGLDLLIFLKTIGVVIKGEGR
jgi:exopolysaccharide biosynthesis polyprenyl glycosylphosphotransferase